MLEIYRATKVALVLLWPLTAYAAQETFGAGSLIADPLAVATTLILSTLAGLTSLLSQMKKDYEEKGKIDRLWLYISSKMSASNLAGLVMYFTADYFHLHRSATAGAIIIAAFGGTWLLDRALMAAADKWLPLKATP